MQIAYRVGNGHALYNQLSLYNQPLCRDVGRIGPIQRSNQRPPSLEETGVKPASISRHCKIAAAGQSISFANCGNVTWVGDAGRGWLDRRAGA